MSTSRPAAKRHVDAMIRVFAFITYTALTLTGALAQDSGALRDIARAQERQADSLRRMERIERDRYRDEDRARRDAERDSRSARRFDR